MLNTDDLDKIGRDIDDGCDEENSEKIRKCLNKLNLLEKQGLNHHEKSTVYYFISNAWAALYQIDGDHTYSWKSKEQENQIYNLRKSLVEIEKTESVTTDINFRVKTNLANALNSVGRFSEAVELWDEVLDEAPSFGMAHGNKGYGLFWYARALYDTGHQSLFLYQSRNHLITALESPLEEHAIGDFAQILENIEKYTDWSEFEISYKEEPLGKSKKEKEYRTWSLENRLFLNPLNDTDNLKIAFYDILTFPPITRKISDRKEEMVPVFYGVYNQLKQDYVSSRFMFFEGIKDQESSYKSHFSDRDVLLYNMLDYRRYGLWIEKIKMSYVSLFSVFDKIAYLINIYFELEIPSNRVNFRTIWFSNGDPKKELNPKIEFSENWPLLGSSQQRYQTHHRNLRIALKHKANPQITIPRKPPHFRLLISGEEFQPNPGAFLLRNHTPPAC